MRAPDALLVEAGHRLAEALNERDASRARIEKLKMDATRNYWPSAPPWMEGDVVTWPIAAQANYYSWLALTRAHDLSAARIANKRLAAQLRELAAHLKGGTAL